MSLTSLVADWDIPGHNFATLFTGLVVTVLLIHLVPYVIDRHHIRRYPGPLLAGFSDAWLAWVARQGRIMTAVHEEHVKRGKFVRITPTHVSIADASALQIIYGHNSGHSTPLKSSFYSSFNPFPESVTIVTARSKEVHARKRKLVSHTFSLKSVTDFEPIIRNYNRILMQHWDRMCTAAAKGEGGTVGECTWTAKNGYAFTDCLVWFNYQVFDIIGDLVFDGTFGMTATASDTAQVVRSRAAAMESYGLEAAKLEYDTIPAVKTINERSKYAISIATIPHIWRPLIKKLPWYRTKSQAMEAIATLAVTAVARRLKAADIRKDNILSRLLEARDENGERMGKNELSAEAMTLMVAGTDTTSNSSAAIAFYLSRNLEAQKKLQRELDDALGPPSSDPLDDSGSSVGSYEQLKNLPYLQDAINEGLRLFSTVGIGLPRVVPPEGLTICGEALAPGTVVSVPTYTVHRDKSIWGEDAEEYVPERWSRGNRVAMQKAFAPFSIGPRACVGRNLGFMEMTIFLGNLFHRYEFTTPSPDYELSVADGFLRKPSDSLVGFRRRAC